MGAKKKISSVNQNKELRPFLGLRSFEEKNKDQFGGRDNEIRELFTLIQNNSLTVVFGKSGIGKTSLLKAGLLPELRQNYYFPIYLRIDYGSPKNPLLQAREMIVAEIRQKDKTAPEIGEKTLWEYFHNLNMLEGLVTPVLILDQFEEAFTLGEDHPEDVMELILELADMAENRIPLSVQEDYQKRGETVPSQYGAQPYRVVISLREDFVPRLEELKNYLPSIMDRRFRVVQMTISQAMDAAIKPGQGLIDEPVAKEIIKSLPGVSQADFEALQKGTAEDRKLKVEPFLLSLLCDRINESRIEKEMEVITLDLVSDFNVTDVISSFYNDSVDKYGPEVEEAIEDMLLTEGGFRKLQALGEFQKKYKIEDRVIDELVSGRIIRKETRDGVDYIELIHDVLTPVIKEKRDKRLAEEREALKRAAIRLANRKNRKRFAVLALILLGVTIYGLVLSWKARENNERRTKVRKSRELVIKAGLTKYDHAFQLGAVVARVAYNMHADANKKSKKKIFSSQDLYAQSFYSVMYKSLYNHKDEIFIIPPSAYDRKHTIKAISLADSLNTFYVGRQDGEVDKISLFKDGSGKERFRVDSTSFNMEKRVTSIAYDESGRSLAIAGHDPYIKVFDPGTGNLTKKIDLQVDPSLKSSKSLVFDDNGRLLLIDRNSIARWDAPYNSRVKWANNPIIIRSYNADKKAWVLEDNTEENLAKFPLDESQLNDSILHFKGNRQLCFAAQNDSIAIGFSRGVILVTKDRYMEFRNPKFFEIREIKFHPSGKYLIMGNKRGKVFTMALDDSYKLSEHHAQGGVIRDIAVSPDNKLVATASVGGYIVLWDVENWGYFQLNTDCFDRPQDKDQYSKIQKISFSADNDYLIAGYTNGVMLKWPISSAELAGLICEELDDFNTETMLNKDYLDEEDIQFLNEYGCVNTGTGQLTNK